jgi:anti-sigma regulatory factor (Ser/Thr protein kinase)
MMGVERPVALLDAPQRGDARAVQVPHRAAGVPAARRAFLEDVAPRLGGDTASDAAVVVSELLGNAVRHADSLQSGVVFLRWQVRGDVVDVEVTDGGGRSSVQPRRPATLSTQGRGLRIVRSLSHEWGVVDADGGGSRTVWAALGGPSRRRHRD